MCCYCVPNVFLATSTQTCTANYDAVGAARRAFAKSPQTEFTAAVPAPDPPGLHKSRRERVSHWHKAPPSRGNYRHSEKVNPPPQSLLPPAPPSFCGTCPCTVDLTTHSLRSRYTMYPYPTLPAPTPLEIRGELSQLPPYSRLLATLQGSKGEHFLGEEPTSTNL
jgi:hypothetical protein